MGRHLSLTKGFRIKMSTQALQSTQRCEGSPDTKTVGTQKEVERERATEKITFCLDSEFRELILP